MTAYADPVAQAEIERLTAERDHWKKRWQFSCEFGDKQTNDLLAALVELADVKDEWDTAVARVAELEAREQWHIHVYHPEEEGDEVIVQLHDRDHRVRVTFARGVDGTEVPLAALDGTRP